ncbi:uncharacterized protein TrAFT101_000002 [Trichoderma asperellum]|uniref:uncharacterized protein n=1 Tax=Trichoderma asperellum TaxID=101201 RepID=UPI00331EF31D|nr:hypothetical protein TrAFT101_000002 [Trichoderma asperellum]
MEAVEDDTHMQPQGKPIFYLKVGVTPSARGTLEQCFYLEDWGTHLSHKGSRNREFIYII